jgi:hypothetical protein
VNHGANPLGPARPTRVAADDRFEAGAAHPMGDVLWAFADSELQRGARYATTDEPCEAAPPHAERRCLTADYASKR